MRGQRQAPAALDPVPILQEARWAPGPVWTGRENLTPPGFDPRTIHRVPSLYSQDDKYPKLKIYITGLIVDSYEYVLPVPVAARSKA